MNNNSKQNKNQKLTQKKKIIIASAIILFFLIINLFGLLTDTENQKESNISLASTQTNSSMEAGQSEGTFENSITDDKNTVSKDNPSIDYSNASIENFKSNIPEYSGDIYITLNKNQPDFSFTEKNTTKSFENYGNLDSLGRVTSAYACLGQDLMPTGERGDISSIYPTGWKQKKYDCVSGKYLYNRCHLIGWQLSGENANKKNLMTGTKDFNVEGMLPFENMVADYIQETNNHVMYRVTPVFEDNNLLAKGVQIEAWSVEDNGEGICFNVFCFNIQEGITIDYKTGNSCLNGDDLSKSETTTKKITTTQKETSAESSILKSNRVYRTPTGKKYHLLKSCGGDASYAISIDDARKAGLEPCKKCAS